jgi:tRNA-dihydrouridine synthase
MRLGWDEQSINAPELARRAEAEGVAMIAVHGRTRCQFYKGRADWSAIRAVKQAVTIPVLANGDGASLADARDMLARSGTDGVMIGRAAVGRPWLVGDIADALRGAVDNRPSLEARRDTAIEHYETLLTAFGIEHGVRHARKHLAGYATHAGCPAGSRRHQDLVTCDDPGRVIDILTSLFDDPALEIAA